MPKDKEQNGNKFLKNSEHAGADSPLPARFSPCLRFCFVRRLQPWKSSREKEKFAQNIFPEEEVAGKQHNDGKSGILFLPEYRFFVHLGENKILYLRFPGFYKKCRNFLSTKSLPKIAFKPLGPNGLKIGRKWVVYQGSTK